MLFYLKKLRYLALIKQAERELSASRTIANF